MIASPPLMTLPEKASRSDCCSIFTFETFTDEIANSTTNSASSSVIMSAYVSSQRSSFSWPAPSV